MNIAISSELVMNALWSLALFSVFWAIERLLYFLSRRFFRDRGERFDALVRQGGGRLSKTADLAAASGSWDFRLRLLAKSRGRIGLLQDLLEAEARACLRFLSFQQNCYTVATSLGLLGTVAGMLEAFTAGSLADASLTTAIGNAMKTTALGLVIGLCVTHGFGMLFTKWRTTLWADLESVFRTFELSKAPPSPAAPTAAEPAT